MTDERNSTLKAALPIVESPSVPTALLSAVASVVRMPRTP